MRMLPTRVVLVPALLLASALQGCGSSGAVVDPQPQDQNAPDGIYFEVSDIRLELEVSGGIAGVGYAFVVDGSNGEVLGLRCEAHCPFDAAETIAVVTAAQVESLARSFVDAGLLALDRSDFGTQCCDQFHYVLSYADGTTERTVQGSSEVFPDLLRVALTRLHGLAYGTRPVLMDLPGSLDDRPRDPLALRSVSLEGSTLTLEVEYTGSCFEHAFDLVAWNGWLESYPVQVGIVLAHDDRGDSCEAANIRRELAFDLGPLREAYREAYRIEGGTVVLRLDDPASDDPSDVLFIDYTF